MILSKILSRILSSRVYGEHVEPTILKNPFPSFSAGFLVWILALLLTSCSSIRRVQTIPIETICDHQVHDTLYINKVQYDSIYVSQNHYVDRGKDTILIRQHDIEYRYKLLRDTIERIKLVVHHDSIPYEVRITETIEVPRKLTAYDRMTRVVFWLLLGFLFLWLYRRLHKRHKL